jgi:hypothetical protein
MKDLGRRSVGQRASGERGGALIRRQAEAGRMSFAAWMGGDKICRAFEGHS